MGGPRSLLMVMVRVWVQIRRKYWAQVCMGGSSSAGPLWAAKFRAGCAFFMAVVKFQHD
jgi:hypothetical protein